MVPPPHVYPSPSSPCDPVPAVGAAAGNPGTELVSRGNLSGAHEAAAAGRGSGAAGEPWVGRATRPTPANNQEV